MIETSQVNNNTPTNVTQTSSTRHHQPLRSSCSQHSDTHHLDSHMNTMVNHHILPHHHQNGEEQCLTTSEAAALYGSGSSSCTTTTTTTTITTWMCKEEQRMRIHAIAEFVAGAFGGLAGICVGYPLDTIKTRMQIFQENHHQFNETFKTKWDYFRGLYRGLTSPLIGELASNFVLFGSFGICKDWISKYSLKENSRDEYSAMKEYAAIFASGAFSGLAISFVVGPTEMIKIQMQTKNGSEHQTIMKCVRELWKTRGFFHGYISCLSHQLTFYSSYFLIYELSKRQFANYYTRQSRRGLSGTLSWALVYPTDSIQSIVRYDRNMNMRKVFKKYTLRDLYRGFQPTVIRAFPVNAVTFYAYELAYKMIAYLHHE
ncbi:hypothetical protein C9374_006167 [Naegleria lovaniensis]|uniref:Mitochondrial carrier protein n=1 Tax=Naegleria lovaniensis TaxID=51637 RepID=A0AA88KJF3_NAELO|nr:uncharacterized protein C9374_006167 [Naegleria lovaniensis]KAG2381783.1 hypothetical protein C9374_006167 [Naegleria lovaniensis]